MQNNSGGKTALGLDANVGAMLTYLPICGISLIYSIIVLVTEKSNKTVRFHAVQSLLISAAFIVIYFAVVIFGTVLVMATGSGALGLLITLLYLVVLVAFLGLMIFGCIKGFTNGSYRLPVLADLADKWA